MKPMKGIWSCNKIKMRCLDVGTQKVYVEAEQPQVRCPKHGVVTTTVPWARHGSLFTKSFAKTAAWLNVHTGGSIVSEFLRVEWHTVGNICQRVYQEPEANSSFFFDGLINIGIDGTSYKKGHKYMTIVVNHISDKNCVRMNMLENHGVIVSIYTRNP